MTYSLHPEAAKEVEEALAFYREQGGIGLARTFLVEFERVAKLLVLSPRLGHIHQWQQAQFPPQTFPVLPDL